MGQAHVSFTGSPSPAYANDAADPDLLYSGGTYYAFTTGTTLGNFLQALTDTTGTPASGWQPFTGGTGSSALPHPPAWETTNSQTSPGVFFYGAHWVMFYDASVSPFPGVIQVIRRSWALSYGSTVTGHRRLLR